MILEHRRHTTHAGMRDEFFPAVPVAFHNSVRDAVAAHETAFLRPVRVSEMSPMFVLD